MIKILFICFQMTDCKCRLLDPHLKGSVYFYLTVSTEVLWNGLQTSSPFRDIWGKKMPFYCWVKPRCSVSVGSRDQLAGIRKKKAFSGVIFVDIIAIFEVSSVNIRHQWITKSYLDYSNNCVRPSANRVGCSFLTTDPPKLCFQDNRHGSFCEWRSKHGKAWRKTKMRVRRRISLPFHPPHGLWSRETVTLSIGKLMAEQQEYGREEKNTEELWGMVEW